MATKSARDDDEHELDKRFDVLPFVASLALTLPLPLPLPAPLGGSLFVT